MRGLKRKPLVIGLAVALVLGMAAWKFAMPSAAEAPRLERYLPAETIGFIQVNNLRAQALNVINSEAWRAFAKENQAASSLFMMGANHMGALDASYAFALVGTSAGEDGKPEPNFVMVGEFNGRDARRVFENRVLSLVRQADEKGVTNKTEQYGDMAINIISREGHRGFAYARAGTALFISNNADALKKVLDVRAGKAQSLETNEAFSRARAAAPYNDGIFGFLNGVALTRLIDSVPAPDASGPAAFRQFFHGAGADAVQTVSFTSAFVDGRVVERFVVVAPNGGTTGILRTIADNPPTSRALLALVPEDAVQAFDASIANAPQTFDQFATLADQLAAQSGKRSLGDALAEFSDKTSINLRGDIIGALGSEVCLVQLPSGDERSGVVILNLKDEALFAQALERLTQTKKLAVSTREYKGVTVRQFTGERGRPLNYAFVGGNFVASPDVAGVERIIDAAQGARSLAASAAYTSASAAMNGAPQFVYYNSNADYLNRLGRILKSSDEGFKTNGQAASGLKPSFAFGLSRADGFYVESHTPLGTFPRLLMAVTSKLSGEKPATATE